MRWAEYFEYKHERYEKIEHYLAEIIFVLRRGEMEFGDCYHPPVSEDVRVKAKKEYDKSVCVSHDEAAKTLKKAFGNGK